MIGGYILRLTAAAVICGIVTALVGQKGASASVVKLLCGLFISFTVLSPLLDMKLTELKTDWSAITAYSEELVTDSKLSAEKEMAAIIKERTESYILDKAQVYGAELTVEVSVASGDIPVPDSVRISGRISPYGKTQLQQMISTDLGIAMEAQTWIS